MKVANFHSIAGLLLFRWFAEGAPSSVEREPDRVVSLGKRATCTPASLGVSTTDDVPAIEAAIKSCGSGGTIVIPAGRTYMIRSTLDFTGCINCIFNLEGTLKASDDTGYWNGKTAIISMSGINKATLQSLTGTGLIDGNGQASYDLFAVDTSYDRPTLHYITGGSTGITIKNIKAKNAPNVFFSATGSSTNIIYSGLTLTSTSSSDNAPKNTDGFNIGPASYVTLTNNHVTNQDDCIAFKSGANYVTVDTISCTGSHGLSVGSLGKTNADWVKNVYVTGATMIGSTKAVGIKVYPGGSSHGTSTVSNITYDGVTVDNSDYAAQIQSCYGETAEYCTSNPSKASITDVYFKNFKGKTSSKYNPNLANINCPASGTCTVYFSGWTVTPYSGTGKYLCANLDNTPGITCSSGASG
jgi:galacturan 1,4-alpha-galacturonidase